VATQANCVRGKRRSKPRTINRSLIQGLRPHLVRLEARLAMNLGPR
jgi:hypothetical protein